MFGVNFLQSAYLPLAQAEKAAQGVADVAKDLPIWQNPFFIFAALLLTIFVGSFASKVVCNSLRLPEFRGRMTMVLVPLFVALLMILYGDLRFGVDLRGGVNFVGSLNLAQYEGEENPPTAESIISQLNQRVNPSGTLEIVIRPLGDDKIEVTIPDVEMAEADIIWERLVSAGKLEFRIVADSRFHSSTLDLARQQTEQGSRSPKVVDKDGKTLAYWVPLARLDARECKPRDIVDGLPAYKFVPARSHLLRNRETNQLFNINDFQYPTNAKLNSRAFTEYLNARGIRPQILVMEPREDENVEGKHLANVTAGTDQNGSPNVNFETKPDGASRMGMLTGLNEPDAEDNKKLLGIVLDGKLHSAPSINGRITNRGEISGNFSMREVNDLTNKLRSGKLDAALNKNPISKDFVESLLGKELQQQGVWAIGISLLLVLVFMIYYYRFAGIVAAMALVLNIILILAVVMAIKQPLTLTGLAGLVLTVGMAVDANVLIFERIREEMERGSTLRMAIRNGFDKARTTIVDANLTTLITALVLYALGTEQVKGFAVTLVLGILMSMFTAIFCSRLVFDIWERKRWLSKLSMTKILDKQKFDFISKISITGVLSALIIGLGIVGMFTLGSRILDHDLRGGSTIRVVFNEAQDIQEIRETLESQNIEVKNEKIEFAVTGFSSDENSSMKDRVFKIDSNLPAWEGGNPEERWRQLDEVMTDVFGSKLKLHKVKLVSGAGVAANLPKVDNDDFGGFQNASWNPVPTVASILSGNPTLLLQDEGAADKKMETEEQTAEMADKEMADKEMADKEMPASEGSDTEPAEQGGDDLLPGGADLDEKAFDTNAGASVQGMRERATTETVVEIEPRILGKSLRAELVDAALRQNIELDPKDVTLYSSDIAQDEAADGTVSANWTIGLKVPQQSDGALVIEEWSKDFNTQPYFPTSSKVGSQIASTMRFNALLAIVFSLLGIIAYIWARFQNIAFGLAAVVALLHDVLFVLGMIALSHYVAGFLGILGVQKFKISLEIIAALLTVIGYSLNDTIVVFDRIREVRGKRKQITADMINTSISQTLSRTILTSVTTFVVVFILYCFGGDAIHGFAFSLVIGVVVGTYSSIFIASPALLWLMNTVGLSPEPVEKVAEAGTV